ncbi:MAG: transcription-repair coupling factor [Candidatus Aminicenantes bacterium]|nr:transcription-repair coupling factor [Candidatus Aminicenantes bacterium]
MSIDFLKKTDQFRRFSTLLDKKNHGISVTGIIESAKAYFLSLIKSQVQKNIVFIQPVNASLIDTKQRCDFFLSQLSLDKDADIFPPLSDSPYQEIPFAMEPVSSRMKFFLKWRGASDSILNTNLLALLSPVPSKNRLRDLFLEVEKGKELDRDSLIQILERYKYERQDILNAHGEYAYRGGIVDVFSPFEQNPFRIEFSGDQVRSLREFETSSQRSVRRIGFILVPSMREFPGKSQSSFVHQNKAKQKANGDLKEYVRDCIYVVDDYDEVQKEWDQLLKDFDDQYQKLKHKNIPGSSPEAIFDLSWWDQIMKHAVRLNELSPPSGNHHFDFSFQSVPRFKNKIPFFLKYLRKIQKESERSAVYLSSEGVREKLSVLLSENQLPFMKSDDPYQTAQDGSVVLLLGQMDHGFRYPELKINYFSEHDIFTEEKVLVSRPRIKVFLSHFQDLKIGDYVVHTDYGIGVFKGLVEMGINHKKQEFIEIMYQDEDKLFVPVQNLNLVQRYSKVSSLLPSLSKLGSPQWLKTQEKTKKAIEKIARELLHLYAKRKAQKGFAFSQKGMWESDFEKTFDYEETEDQQRAIQEVRQDMESPSPMDRLLCGDVGYGKTEVALRAAFKAVMDGKQVAVLSPTTVLSSQHLKTFRNRMILFPIRVEGLTRLQSKKAQKNILRDIKKGLVDIVIGTHRLVSGDVEFKDLGLLIIDEEQRFGVKHKEKIKKMRSDIDVLTMTATPIPRTLNLSLSGLSDISLIETPPRDRLAIHTTVGLFSKKMISSAIKRELNRDGQVYYVHNRVQDIETISKMIEKWVPQAQVVTVHGQMKGKTLEKRMLDFIQGKHNVLISTTIIENGIDIPRVNTLIVNRADRFGLAQLYQLRGRVGRSSRQAFAYFLVPPFSELTPTAKERLNAIKEFAELGSGFRLAAKDLEIRGAGNFLGEQQHGFMEAVGFDYYMYLLDQTIRRLKGEPTEVRKSRIDLKTDIRIPDGYIPQVSLRMDLYKRVSSIDQLSELSQIKEEVKDRYGLLPQSVHNLFKYGEIKHLAQKLGIESIDRTENRIMFKFFPETNADVSRLTKCVQQYCGTLTPQGAMTLKLSSRNENKILDETIFILKQLTLL